jgi:hypothetical protein
MKSIVVLGIEQQFFIEKYSSRKIIKPIKNRKLIIIRNYYLLKYCGKVLGLGTWILVILRPSSGVIVG